MPHSCPSCLLFHFTGLCILSPPPPMFVSMYSQPTSAPTSSPKLYKKTSKHFSISSIRNHESCGPKAVVFSVHACPCPLRDKDIQPQGLLKLIQSYFVTSSSGPPPPQLWENTDSLVPLSESVHPWEVRPLEEVMAPPPGVSRVPRRPLSPHCVVPTARGF